MVRLERDPTNRKRKVLPGVGAIVKTGGWTSEQQELRVDDGRVWLADRKGWKMERVFSDALGTQVARWRGEGVFQRGGRIELTTGAPTVRLEPTSRWKECYDLVVDGRRVAALECRSSGKIDVERVDPSADAMLVLAATWMVGELNEDAAAAASAT